MMIQYCQQELHLQVGTAPAHLKQLLVSAILYPQAKGCDQAHHMSQGREFLAIKLWKF